MHRYGVSGPAVPATAARTVGSPQLEGQSAAYMKDQASGLGVGPIRNDITRQMRSIARVDAAGDRGRDGPLRMIAAGDRESDGPTDRRKSGRGPLPRATDVGFAEEPGRAALRTVRGPVFIVPTRRAATRFLLRSPPRRRSWLSSPGDCRRLDLTRPEGPAWRIIIT